MVAGAELSPWNRLRPVRDPEGEARRRAARMIVTPNQLNGVFTVS
jgi:hypothetical protein